MKGRVILVRHGSTALNKKDNDPTGSAERIRGWADIPLDKDGKAEALELAKEMRSEPLEMLWSSDLRRAEDLAMCIAKAMALGKGEKAPVLATEAQDTHALVKVRTTTKLRPWHLGDFTGKAVKDVIPAMRAAILDEDKSVPGGEPFSTFRERYLGFLSELLTAARKRGRVIACVTHSRNFQCTKAWLAKGEPPDLSIDPKVMNDYSNETPTGDRMELS